jgi:hypothetical protein
MRVEQRHGHDWRSRLEGQTTDARLRPFTHHAIGCDAALAVQHEAAAAAEHRMSGEEGVLVAASLPYRERPQTAREGKRPAEDLRLRHERKTAAGYAGQEEVIEIGGMVGSEDDRARGGHVIRVERPHPVGGEQRPDDDPPRQVVAPSGLARAHVRVKPGQPLPIAGIATTHRIHFPRRSKLGCLLHQRFRPPHDAPPYQHGKSAPSMLMNCGLVRAATKDPRNRLGITRESAYADQVLFNKGY